MTVAWLVMNLLTLSLTHTTSRTMEMLKTWLKVLYHEFNLNQTLNLAVSVYHHSLCENGVKDYSLENFLIDVQIAICEQALQLVKTVNDLTPSSFEKMMIQFSGEEKAKDMMKLLESGAFVRPVLVLTSLYVKDKEKFLIVN